MRTSFWKDELSSRHRVVRGYWTREYPLAFAMDRFGWKNITLDQAKAMLRFANEYAQPKLKPSANAFDRRMLAYAFYEFGQSVTEEVRKSLGLELRVKGPDYIERSDFGLYNLSSGNGREVFLDWFLRNSCLAKVLSAEQRFEIFCNLADSLSETSHSKIQFDVSYKEWKESTSKIVHERIAAMKESASSNFDFSNADIEGVLPLFSNDKELSAFTNLYQEQQTQRLLASLDAIESHVVAIDNGMESLSKLGSFRENKDQWKAEVRADRPGKHASIFPFATFDITVTDIGGGVIAKEVAKSSPILLFLLAIPILIISAIIQANFQPTGAFGDIVVFSGGIASAYILFCIVLCAIRG